MGFVHVEKGGGRAAIERAEEEATAEAGGSNAALSVKSTTKSRIARRMVRVIVELGQTLLDSGLVPGLHFFTLNLEHSVTTIVHKLGLASSAVLRRRLPWRASASGKRDGEDVRPIFWANRPTSYMKRTEEWESFPSRRWCAHFFPTVLYD